MIFEMLEYGDSQAINMTFTTNGSIYNEKFGVVVKKLKRTRIIFSIDGVNENTYRKMRPQGNLKKILEGIKKKCPKL